MRRLPPSAILATLGLLAGACQSSGAQPRRPLEVPGAVSGGTRGGGRPDTPTAESAREQERLAAEDKRKAAETAKATRAREAEELWNRAAAERDPDDAADLYGELANDYKESARAEEARWLQASRAYEARDSNAAVTALETYVKEYPVNPHLADVERMLYEASLWVFQSARGLVGIFRSDQKGYDGLNTIVERFPEGRYADDALLALGDEYVRKDELASACLQYRNLLLKYPDSEWSFRARLKLADTYLARDQGAAYNAGYVDLDPRVPKSPQYEAQRPVRSCVEAALEHYQAFLDRIATDPARRGEYASETAYAQGRVAECRRRLADKDRAVAAYYAGRGQGNAAETYRRFAENVEAGRPWSSGVPRSTPTTVPPGSPAATPSMTPPGRTGTPSTVPPPPPVPSPKTLPPGAVPPGTVTPGTVPPGDALPPPPPAPLPPPPPPPSPPPPSPEAKPATPAGPLPEQPPRHDATVGAGKP